MGATAAIPPLPVEQLATTGVRAVTAWLDGVLADAASRTAWFAELAGLIPGSAVAATGDAVEVAVGDAHFRIALRTQPGPSGRLRLTPTVEVDLGSGANRVQAIADLLETDLGGGPTRALPRLALWAHLGRSEGGTEPVVLDLPAADPTPAVRVEAVRVGLELDDARRPVVVLAADRVQIGSHGYPTLDLTSTDALMDAAGAAVEELVTALLAQLGDAGQVVQLLVGLQPPPGQAARAHDHAGRPGSRPPRVRSRATGTPWSPTTPTPCPRCSAWCATSSPPTAPSPAPSSATAPQRRRGGSASRPGSSCRSRSTAPSCGSPPWARPASTRSARGARSSRATPASSWPPSTWPAATPR